MPWLITNTDDCMNWPRPVCMVRDSATAARMVEEGNAAGRHNGPLHDGYAKRLWTARHIYGSPYRRGTPFLNEPAYPVPEPEWRRVAWDDTLPQGSYEAEEVQWFPAETP